MTRAARCCPAAPTTRAAAVPHAPPAAIRPGAPTAPGRCRAGAAGPFGVAQRGGSPIERLLRLRGVLLGPAARRLFERVGRRCQRSRHVRVRGRGIGRRFPQRVGAVARSLLVELAGAVSELLEVARGLLRVALRVRVLAAGRGARDLLRQPAEGRILLRRLRIGHAGELLLHRADAGERRLSILPLGTQLPHEVPQLVDQLLAAWIVGLTRPLRLVGDIFDAVGDVVRRVARGAAVGEDAVLRIRPDREERDERQGDDPRDSRSPCHVRSDAVRGSTAASRARASRSWWSTSSPAGPSGASRAASSMAVATRSRRPSSSSARRAVSTSDGRRARHHAIHASRAEQRHTEMEERRDLKRHRARGKLDERRTCKPGGDGQNRGTQRATKPQASPQPAQVAHGILAEACPQVGDDRAIGS